MHNCKATRKKLVDLALNQTEQRQVPAEVGQCAGCREEFASLRNALRSTEATMLLSEPVENFWPGYRERLRARLETDTQPPAPVAPGGLGPWLRRLANASISVPVPVALALLPVIGFSLFFMTYARPSSSVTSILTPASVITRTVEVPVVQEKLVTRVVYRNVRQAQRGPATPERVDEAIDNQQMEPPAVRTLEGFKPAHEAKLTIIKGSAPDEK
jgi:hypothetical protein